ncbi:MAG: MFS transporter [Chloroflexi bacterium]|nr:MFS transporter [Chloroflexota bacterium]MDA1147226.1 MFS transporter [Chloroflexota bacterium]
MPGGGMPGGGMGRPGMGPPMGGNRPSLRKALAVFSNRDYRFLWTSSLVSFTGMQMQQIARAVLAWDLTGSYSSVGAVFLSFGAPMLLFSLMGGAFADRLNKRNLTLMTQIGTGVLMLVTAVLIVTDMITIELLIIVGLAQGTFFAFGMPARSPLMAVVVGPEHLMSAMALQNAAMNMTRLGGPAIAGILIGVWGVEAAYFTQSGLYIVSVALLLMVPSSRGVAEQVKRGSMFREIVLGVRYAWGDSILRMLLMLAFTTALFAMPYQILLNGFVDEDLGRSEGTYAFLQMLTGIGAVIGSFGVAAFTEYDRKPLLQLVSGLLGAAGLLVLGLGSFAFGFPGAVVGILILGLMLTIYQTLNQTMIMAAAKPEYYGRVMSMMMLTFSTMPLMGVPLGILADRVGATNVFIGQGVLVAVVLGLLALMNRSYTFERQDMRHVNDRTPSEDAAGAQPIAEREGASTGAR